jgi:hypothetical protein
VFRDFQPVGQPVGQPVASFKRSFNDLIKFGVSVVYILSNKVSQIHVIGLLCLAPSLKIPKANVMTTAKLRQNGHRAGRVIDYFVKVPNDVNNMTCGICHKVVKAPAGIVGFIMP